MRLLGDDIGFGDISRTKAAKIGLVRVIHDKDIVVKEGCRVVALE